MLLASILMNDVIYATFSRKVIQTAVKQSCKGSSDWTKTMRDFSLLCHAKELARHSGFDFDL